MDTKWKKVDVEFGKKNTFMLKQSPIHSQIQGLQIWFKPSTYWLKKNSACEPRMKTDLIAGLEVYKLPRYFRRKTIEKVEALLPD